MDLAQLISDFIEKNGLAAFAFVAIAILFWRSQSHQKERDKAQSEIEKERVKAEKDARKEENLLQSNILNMYNRFDSTLASLNDTLNRAFAITHEDKVESQRVLEDVAKGLVNQTNTIDGLEKAIGMHTDERPGILEELQKINENISQVRIDLTFIKNNLERTSKAVAENDERVTLVTANVDAIQQQVNQVEKTVTSEIPQAKVPITNKQESIDKKADIPPGKEL